MVDHDHLEAGGAKAREVLLDDCPGRNGLTVGRLPPGAGERTFDVDGEEHECEQHQQPSYEHTAKVGGRPGAESGKQARTIQPDPVSVGWTAIPGLV